MPVLPNATLPGPNGTPGASFGSQLTQAIGTNLYGAVGLTQQQTQNRQDPSSMFRYTAASTNPVFNPIFPQASSDWRVRISLAPGSNYFYNDPSNILLSPLTNRGTKPNSAASVFGSLFNSGIDQSGAERIGVVFPYTPQISVTHTANYSPQKLTHSNYTQYFYDNSEVQAISVTGDFTVQNISEGQYLLATIYFFRAITKMFFGNDGAMTGNPPPLVYLNGYGKYYFPNVPCLVTSFQHTMPGEVDYMDIPEPAYTGGSGYTPVNANPRMNSTRLPTTSSITLTLQPVYSRYAQSQQFSLNDFAAGGLINNNATSRPASGFGDGRGRTNGGFI